MSVSPLQPNLGFFSGHASFVAVGLANRVLGTSVEQSKSVTRPEGSSSKEDGSHFSHLTSDGRISMFQPDHASVMMGWVL